MSASQNPEHASALQEIEKWLAQSTPIPASRVSEFLESGNPAVIVATLRLLAEHHTRLDSSCVPGQICKAVLNCFRRCFQNSFASLPAAERHQIGRSFCAWFSANSAGEAFPSGAVQDLLRLLAETYKNGDARLRDALVSDVLEQLFESRRLTAYFVDWQDDLELLPAFTKALEWGEGFWPR